MRCELVIGVSVIGAIACGEGVHDLSIESAPIVILRGHVDLDRLERTRPEAPLLGGLLWAGLPRINPVCLSTDAPALLAACPDPYGVFFGSIDRMTTVDEHGDFEVPIWALPDPKIAIGDEATRIAYGALVVAEDLDGDGRFFMPPLRMIAEGGITGGGGAYECLDDGRRPRPPPIQPDLIVAASFATLRSEQTRVTFREGDFVEASKFYPAPGCDAPLPGFSYFTMPALGESGACTSRAPDEPLDIAPLAAAERPGVMCRPLGQSPGSARPEESCPPPEGDTPVCLSRELLVSLRTSFSCPEMTIYSLKGCDTDPYCTNPEWDDTATPPTWWPCS
jgi:hypothetical protein